MRRKVTRPKQAGSKSWLDKMQREVKGMIKLTREAPLECRGYMRVLEARLKGLLASMQSAETR